MLIATEVKRSGLEFSRAPESPPNPNAWWPYGLKILIPESACPTNGLWLEEGGDDD